MNLVTILIGGIVSFAVVYMAYTYFKNTQYSSSELDIISTTHDGRKSFTSDAVPSRSYDKADGIEFSYVCWFRVDDYTYRYGKRKPIFIKGTSDMKAMCPGVFIDSNTNTLLIYIDTFGSQETITIPNMTAKKWMHLGIVVKQESVDVYINGLLKLHHTLMQLPKQNNSQVIAGIDGGFDGKLSGLKYYNYALNPSDIQSTLTSAPKPSADDAPPAMPPYFDLTWWIGRE
jgi:hypothetical protein